MLLGTKYHDDRKLLNDQFGKIGGIKLAELNLLEVAFLETIGFNLSVSTEMFNGYLHEILNADANYVRDVNWTIVELSRRRSEDSESRSVDSDNKSEISNSISTSEKTPNKGTPTLEVGVKPKESTAIDNI